MSPSSSGLFAATLRKILLIILPERVLGRPCATCNENICVTIAKRDIHSSEKFNSECLLI